MRIKYSFIVVFLFTSIKLFSQTDSIPKTYPLKVKLENLDSAKVWRDKSYFRHLRISIINKGDTSFSFWVMTCSWWGCVRTRPSTGGPHVFGCDRNFPEKITLRPGEFHKLEEEFAFVRKKRLQFQVGFRVITELPETESLSEFINNPIKSPSKRLSIFSDGPQYTDKDFIWSNELMIVF